MIERALEVIVIGSAGVDTNVFLPGADIDFSVEANFTENLDTVGQAGGYASRGYAQLGKRVAFIGHLGDDHSGKLVRETFERDGIDTSAVFLDTAGTARSVNFMYGDGRRKNFYDGKGHMTLELDLDFGRQVMEGARLAHFNIPNWARRLLPLARELGLTVACDIQDLTRPDDPYRQDFIEAADILFFSAHNFPDPRPLVESFLAGKPGQIIIAGMGAQGCLLGTGDGIRHFEPVQLNRPVVDTNGAGDSLAVGFLTSYVLDGFPMDESVWRGQIAARHACTLRGTSDGLINRQQLDRFYLELISRQEGRSSG